MRWRLRGEYTLPFEDREIFCRRATQGVIRFRELPRLADRKTTLLREKRGFVLREQRFAINGSMAGN